MSKISRFLLFLSTSQIGQGSFCLSEELTTYDAFARIRRTETSAVCPEAAGQMRRLCVWHVVRDEAVLPAAEVCEGITKKARSNLRASRPMLSDLFIIIPVSGMMVNGTKTASTLRCSDVPEPDAESILRSARAKSGAGKGGSLSVL